MLANHQRQVLRFQRSIEFVEKHNNEFAPGSRALSLANQLKEVVGQLGVVPEKKKSVKSDAPASGKLAALNALREELGRIARTAKTIQDHNPDFNNTFILPDKRRKEELAKAAQQFIKDAKASLKDFKEYEVKDNFLDVLQEKLDAYNQSQAVSAPSRQGSGASLSETGVIVQKGAGALDALDVIMHNKYEKTDPLLSEWKSASGAEVVKRKTKKDKATK